MLRFAFAKSFSRQLKRFQKYEKLEIQRVTDSFMLAMDARHPPAGLGLKKLAGNIWEFRINLAIRILFGWRRNTITFLFAGNHNETRQFLKHFL
ncbi:hypothetical protein ACFL6Y_11225 [Elusimicrobiota bacterium]